MAIKTIISFFIFSITAYSQGGCFKSDALNKFFENEYHKSCDEIPEVFERTSRYTLTTKIKVNKFSIYVDDFRRLKLYNLSIEANEVIISKDSLSYGIVQTLDLSKVLKLTVEPQVNFNGITEKLIIHENTFKKNLFTDFGEKENSEKYLYVVVSSQNFQEDLKNYRTQNIGFTLNQNMATFSIKHIHQKSLDIQNTSDSEVKISTLTIQSDQLEAKVNLYISKFTIDDINIDSHLKRIIIFKSRLVKNLNFNSKIEEAVTDIQLKEVSTLPPQFRINSKHIKSMNNFYASFHFKENDPKFDINTISKQPFAWSKFEITVPYVMYEPVDLKNIFKHKIKSLSLSMRQSEIFFNDFDGPVNQSIESLKIVRSKKLNLQRLCRFLPNLKSFEIVLDDDLNNTNSDINLEDCINLKKLILSGASNRKISTRLPLNLDITNGFNLKHVYLSNKSTLTVDLSQANDFKIQNIENLHSKTFFIFKNLNGPIVLRDLELIEFKEVENCRASKIHLENCKGCNADILNKCISPETETLRFISTDLSYLKIPPSNKLSSILLNYNYNFSRLELAKLNNLEKLELQHLGLESFDLNDLKLMPMLETLIYQNNYASSLKPLTELYEPKKLKVALITSKNPDYNRKPQILNLKGDGFNFFTDSLLSKSKMRKLNPGLNVYFWSY